jgi:hypothetical protein
MAKGKKHTPEQIVSLLRQTSMGWRHEVRMEGLPRRNQNLFLLEAKERLKEDTTVAWTW